MAIHPEIVAQILRLYHAEKWRKGTIARHLSIHHSVVERVVRQAGPQGDRPEGRATLLDPYLPLILETLKKYPTLTASRLYGMMRERGYRGSADHFRHLIARHRPRRAAEAFQRLRTLSGEQGQVDWAHL